MAGAPGADQRAIHEGLLENDIVSSTRRWARKLVRSCADFVGVEVEEAEDRSSTATGASSCATAISIDPAEFDELAASEPVRAAEEELLGRRPEKLILQVDRTDLSKNIVRGFRAFEAYLHDHPEMHGRVTMLAMLDPSRQDIPDYAEYLAALQRAAESVNDQFQLEELDADRAARGGRFREVGRRLQAVRRLARERDLRRTQPHREGSAARERAGRRAHPVQNTGAHEELGAGR